MIKNELFGIELKICGRRGMSDQSYSEHVHHVVEVCLSILLGSSRLVAVQDENALIRLTNHSVDIFDSHVFIC